MCLSKCSKTLDLWNCKYVGYLVKYYEIVRSISFSNFYLHTFTKKSFLRDGLLGNLVFQKVVSDFLYLGSYT